MGPNFETVEENFISPINVFEKSFKREVKLIYSFCCILEETTIARTEALIRPIFSRGRCIARYRGRGQENNYG